MEESEQVYDLRMLENHEPEPPDAAESGSGKISIAERVAAARMIEDARTRAAEILAEASDQAARLLEDATTGRRAAGDLLSDAETHARSSRDLANTLLGQAEHDRETAERLRAEAEQHAAVMSEVAEQVEQSRADAEADRETAARSLREAQEEADRLTGEAMLLREAAAADAATVSRRLTHIEGRAREADQVLETAHEVARRIGEEADLRVRSAEEMHERAERTVEESRQLKLEAEWELNEARTLAEAVLAEADEEAARLQADAANLRAEAQTIFGEARTDRDSARDELAAVRGRIREMLEAAHAAVSVMTAESDVRAVIEGLLAEVDAGEPPASGEAAGTRAVEAADMADDADTDGSERTDETDETDETEHHQDEGWRDAGEDDAPSDTDQAASAEPDHAPDGEWEAPAWGESPDRDTTEHDDQADPTGEAWDRDEPLWSWKMDGESARLDEAR